MSALLSYLRLFPTQLLKTKSIYFYTSMNLKEIKREIDSLSSVDEDISKFQKSWLKPFLSNSGKTLNVKHNLPFLVLNNLDKGNQTELNLMLKEFQEKVPLLKSLSYTNNKIRNITHILTEIKLLEFQAESYGEDLANSKELKTKLKFFNNKLLNDDFNSLNTTINEVKAFDQRLSEIHQSYEEINEFLCQNLPLEDSVSIMELPHKNIMKRMRNNSQKRKNLVKELGQHFLVIQRKLTKPKLSSRDKSKHHPKAK